MCKIYARYLKASRLLAEAVPMILKIIADAVAPTTESESREFLVLLLGNKGRKNGLTLFKQKSNTK